MPEINAEKFILTDEKYNSGVAIDEYNGLVSIVNARKIDDGRIFAEWAYPQKRKDGQSVPHTKALPWKIQLGSNREEALRVLRLVAGMLKSEPEPVSSKDDDIPF